MRASVLGGAAALAALTLRAAALAGQAAGPVSVDALRPPASAAFVLLGIEPVSVTQPSTPRALSTWALSLTEEGGLIPRNLAAEVAPYWLVPRPGFSFEDFFAGSAGAEGPLATLGTTVARSFALSVASAPRVVESDTLGSSLALAARTLLWPGRAPRGLAERKRRLEAGLGACAAEEDPGALAECFARLAPLRDSLRAGIREPVGFVLQLSGGASFDSPTDALQEARWRRAGVWISPSYRSEGRVDLTLVGRYLRDRGDSTTSAESDLLDAGMRLTWRPSAALALSAEGLRRWSRRSGSPDGATPRWGGLVEYRAREDWYLFYAFGKDFAADGAPTSPLFASLGLSLGFGQKPRVVVP